ncbi:hypothetical protein MKX01_040389 [Papaver californicum]|nr:hypothetical protein MKX01_040389 [Papaver californicum]
MVSSLCTVDRVNGVKVRGVNLGNWLVIGGWIKPSLFDGIPSGDMLDGAKVQFKSLKSNMYVQGGREFRRLSSLKETFTIERASNDRVHIKHSSGRYLHETYGNELKADYVGTPGFDDGNSTMSPMGMNRKKQNKCSM